MRYGQLAKVNQLAMELQQPLLENINRKGVYFECCTASLINTILIHCGNKSTGTFLGKILNTFKTNKTPIVKAWMLNFIGLILVLRFFDDLIE